MLKKTETALEDIRMRLTDVRKVVNEAIMTVERIQGNMPRDRRNEVNRGRNEDLLEEVNYG